MGNCVSSTRQKLEEELELSEDSEELEWIEESKLHGIVDMRSGRSHWKRREMDSTCPCLGSCSCPQNALPLSSCVFYPPRIQDLIKGRRSELETTQAHWTEINDKTDVEMVRVGEENRKYFDEVLMNDARWGGFFSKFEDLIVLEKIGEGGQAEIFQAKMEYGDYEHDRLVAKVFKMNIPLRDLKQQWPLEDLCRVSDNRVWNPFREVYGGTFIKEGIHKNKFAFVMRRFVCDLRAFIDERMLKLVCSSSHGPPFGDIKYVCNMLKAIALDMCALHERGVVHRDIKASNVLLAATHVKASSAIYLMDFECALGAMGTGFWRAPEILNQVRRRVPSQEVVFTKEGDIYSFGMLCYEVVTGCIPFDGHPQNDYSIVLEGVRPELPSKLHSTLRRLILDCWEENPQHRPSAGEIVYTLKLLLPKR